MDSCILKIGKGILVLLGVEKGDDKINAEKLAEKIAKLRIFEDEDGKMNRSVIDVCGEILVVSQFTLCGDCKKAPVRVLINLHLLRLQKNYMNILPNSLKLLTFRFVPVSSVL